jgi:mono/diheme cytochrome c family protein
MARFQPVGLPIVALTGFCLLFAGCSESIPPQFASSHAVKQLDPELQQAVVAELLKYCGTPETPRLLGNRQVTLQHLQHGARVYRDRCVACHGVTGDGAGPAAAIMDPKPRDYRTGSFKFTSTGYGSKPLREDLIKVVRRGAKGTSMPSFNLLPEEDIEAVVDYVLVLTHRGELESQLAMMADSEGEVDPEMTPELIAQIEEVWAMARDEIVHPISAPIPYSLESAEIGRQAFFTEQAGCVKCHGVDGRGRDIPNFMPPGGSDPITVRSADLTTGMFHGGDQPIDIYRRIFAGINGTPMPGFGQSLSEQPDTLWHLVNYVQYVANGRRREVVASAPTLQRRVTPGSISSEAAAAKLSETTEAAEGDDEPEVTDDE